MATTISGPTVTDDSGTPASPVGDGTLFDASFFSSFYAAINAMWSGATQVFDGVLTVSGKGTHTFSTSGTGANIVRIQQATAGTGNRGALELGTNTDADAGRLEAYSSTYTETGAIKQDGVALRSMQDGGLSLAAEHASGDVRVYARGTTKVATFNGEELEITGSTRGNQHVVGVLDDSVTTTKVGNAADTNWTTLYSYTFPANTFDENDRIARTTLIIDLTAGQKDFEIWFGGTAGDNCVQLLNNSTSSGGSQKLDIQIARVASNSQRVFCNHSDGVGAISGLTATTQTDSGTIELLVRVKSDTSTANVGQLYFGFTEMVR